MFKKVLLGIFICLFLVSCGGSEKEEIVVKDEVKVDVDVDVDESNNSKKYEFEIDENGDIILFRRYIESKDVVIPQELDGKKVVAIYDNFEQMQFNKTIVIPEGIKSIGENAFKENSFTELIIPESLTKIGNWAFCFNKINKLKLSNKMKIINKGTFAANDLETLIIPDSITNIESKAFYRNKLKKLVIPKSVIKIGDEAFAINRLEEVELSSRFKNDIERIFGEREAIRIRFIYVD